MPSGSSVRLRPKLCRACFLPRTHGDRAPLQDPTKKLLLVQIFSYGSMRVVKVEHREHRDFDVGASRCSSTVPARSCGRPSGSPLPPVVILELRNLLGLTEENRGHRVKPFINTGFALLCWHCVLIAMRSIRQAREGERGRAGGSPVQRFDDFAGDAMRSRRGWTGAASIARIEPDSAEERSN